jgi:hypothetical protein
MPFCNGMDRAASAGIPGPKGRRLPHEVSTIEKTWTGLIIGDVRQCKLNRPMNA